MPVALATSIENTK